MNNYGAKSSSGYRFTLLDGGLLLAIASLIGWG
ncbi:putative membrane protein, partial [Vibrio cholerae HC-41A1]